jgi:hypothetical protein
MMKGYKATSKVIDSLKSSTFARPSEVIRPHAKGKAYIHTYITKCTHRQATAQRHGMTTSTVQNHNAV